MSRTVAELVRERLDQMTPAERKVARTLLGEYPLLGLNPVAKLAAAAGVSAPSVIRLVAKLGFDGYQDFQDALKEEVAVRLSSPAEILRERPHDAGSPHELLHAAEQALCSGIRSSFEAAKPSEVDRVVRLLADERLRVSTVGGRFSAMLAWYLAVELQLLRPRVGFVGAGLPERANALLDIGKRDVVAAFDYRRYQADTVAFAQQARRQGARLVLFTDPYLSPLAAEADVVFVSSVDSTSPFDALTPALAMVEALVGAVVGLLGDRPIARLARYEQLNAEGVGDEPPSWHTNGWGQA